MVIKNSDDLYTIYLIILSKVLVRRVVVTDYRHYVETRDRHLEGSKTASTPPYILIANRYYLQITVPISAIYYPILSYYPHLLRVYIEALDLHLQSSRSCIPHSAKAYRIYYSTLNAALKNSLPSTSCYI